MAVSASNVLISATYNRTASMLKIKDLDVLNKIKQNAEIATGSKTCCTLDVSFTLSENKKLPTRQTYTVNLVKSETGFEQAQSKSKSKKTTSNEEHICIIRDFFTALKTLKSPSEISTKTTTTPIVQNSYLVEIIPQELVHEDPIKHEQITKPIEHTPTADTPSNPKPKSIVPSASPKQLTAAAPRLTPAEAKYQEFYKFAIDNDIIEGKNLSLKNFAHAAASVLSTATKLTLENKNYWGELLQEIALYIAKKRTDAPIKTIKLDYSKALKYFKGIAAGQADTLSEEVFQTIVNTHPRWINLLAKEQFEHFVHSLLIEIATHDSLI